MDRWMNLWIVRSMDTVLGGFLGPLEAPLGPSGGLLGSSRGPCWAFLGPSGGPRGPLGVVLGALLEPKGSQLSAGGVPRAGSSHRCHFLGRFWRTCWRPFSSLFWTSFGGLEGLSGRMLANSGGVLDPSVAVKTARNVER